MNGGRSILLQELCLLIDVIICFGIPIAGILILKKRYGKVSKPFFIGMAAFVVSQILIRIPILSLVLPNFTWFLTLQLNPYLYGIFLGLSAGVFEETARLIFMKLFLKGRTHKADGLAFGLGHGGIEAMLIVGVGCISSMILYPMGTVDLSGVGYLSLLTGGIERIFAISFHIGASLIILYGIRENKALRYTLLAILLHGLLDSMLVILPAAIGLGSFGLELYIMIVSLLVLAFGLWLFSKHNCFVNKKSSLVIKKGDRI
jgi:Predicted membrane protein